MATPHLSEFDRAECFGAAIDGGGDGYAVLRAVRDDGAIVDWVVIDANALVRNRWSPVLDVIGTKLTHLDQAAPNPDLLATYEAAAELGTRQTIDIELVVPEGKGGWRRIVVVPVDAETITVTTRDITRERYFEIELEQHRLAATAVTVESSSDTLSESALAVEARFARWSAVALFVSAGFLSGANSFVSRSEPFNVAALRITAVITVLIGIAMAFAPWERFPRGMGRGVVIGALLLLAISDYFDHYSRTQAALAIYPVFFIIVVAWAGMTQGRGAALGAAVLSAPVLGWMLTASGRTIVGVQSVAVTLPAAAVLGEVLAWSYSRATQLARIEAERHLHDSLTGLANRVALAQRLDRGLSRARQSGLILAVLFIDLDRFKQVNDILGHAAGDQLLVETARRIQSIVRSNDTVARIGGDEFVVLCEGLDGQMQASEIAERIIAAIEEPFRWGVHEAHVSASVGIVLCLDGAETAETMLKKADTAMYRAKGSGRARLEMFDEAMQDWVAARTELEVALRDAVEREELRVFYQPILEADSGRIASFEALVRWERPGYGLVSPADFIPIAEETGLIIDIGTWVLNVACRDAAGWAQRWPERHLAVAVNVSSLQFLKGNLLEVVGNALSTSGLDPTLLTLELTETTLVDDAVATEAQLRALRERGTSIALDDFGTGYSSLTYLRSFPINVIKIDRSFVRTIGTEREDTAIVAAVVALARNLDLKVVAEGIETHEQLATLLYLNCDHLQGYLFSRPVALELVAALVEGPPLGVAGHGQEAA